MQLDAESIHCSVTPEPRVGSSLICSGLNRMNSGFPFECLITVSRGERIVDCHLLFLLKARPRLLLVCVVAFISIDVDID